MPGSPCYRVSKFTPRGTVAIVRMGITGLEFDVFHLDFGSEVDGPVERVEITGDVLAEGHQGYNLLSELHFS